MILKIACIDFTEPDTQMLPCCNCGKLIEIEVAPYSHGLISLSGDKVEKLIEGVQYRTTQCVDCTDASRMLRRDSHLTP